MSSEELLDGVLDVQPAGREHLSKNSRVYFELLRNAMYKWYCYVYNSEFQNTAEENNDWVGDGLR